MFYIVPGVASSRCFQPAPGAGAPQLKRNWTKSDTVGGGLDLLLIVGVAVTLTLAACAYYNVPLGFMNGISVINVPFMISLGGAAAVLIVLDLGRVISKGCKKTPHSLANPPYAPIDIDHPSSKTKPSEEGSSDPKPQGRRIAGPYPSNRQTPFVPQAPAAPPPYKPQTYTPAARPQPPRPAPVPPALPEQVAPPQLVEGVEPFLANPTPGYSIELVIHAFPKPPEPISVSQGNTAPPPLSPLLGHGNGDAILGSLAEIPPTPTHHLEIPLPPIPEPPKVPEPYVARDHFYKARQDRIVPLQAPTASQDNAASAPSSPRKEGETTPPLGSPTRLRRSQSPAGEDEVEIDGREKEDPSVEASGRNNFSWIIKPDKKLRLDLSDQKKPIDHKREDVDSIEKELEGFDLMRRSGHEALDMFVDRDVAQTAVQGLRWAAGQVVSAMQQGANLVLNVYDAMKAIMKPGAIQMRFYTLQINFIVEKLLAYNETTNCFDKPSLPLSFHSKFELLENIQFQNEQIEEFRKKVVHIIRESNEDKKAADIHPFSTRKLLLYEIEADYNNLIKPLQSDKKEKESNTSTPVSPFHAFLQGLCYQLYAKFDAISYGFELARLFLAPIDEEAKFSDLPTILKNDQDKIKSISTALTGSKCRDKVSRLCGAADQFFFPMLTSNFACKLWEERYHDEDSNNEHTVEIVRFGSPTIKSKENMGASPDLLGQMELFVQKCQLEGKTIFSFQHQYYKGNEAPRLAVMKQLAKDYPDTFYFINMEMDSDFYKQSGTPEFTYEEFKVALLEHINGLDKSQNFIDKIKQIDSYEADMNGLADQIYQDYFADAMAEDRKLSVRERRDFIFMFYARYRNYLHEKCRPHFSCHQCKDTMDRSMTLADFAHALNAVKLNQQNEPQFIANIRNLMSFVGLIVKGSAMDHERFDRFLSALDRLCKNQVVSGPSLLKEQPLHGRDLRHRFSKFPCDAHDREDYKACELMSSTNNSFIPVAPYHEDIDPKALIQKLYHNNNLVNVDVRIEGNVFVVYENEITNVLAKGEIKLEDNRYMIQVT